MKGIILAGGSGTRLYPLTKFTSKQLLPVNDKPMIYYPLSVLMLANIKEILIISNPEYIQSYKKLFGNGNKLGMNINYATQSKPRGLADAFIIGEKFIGNDDVCLILGDNILYGHNLNQILKNAVNNLQKNKCTIFGYYVKDSSSYGVIEFDRDNKVKSIIEKPKNPKSNYAAIGLYFYTNDVIKYAKHVKPSERGEIEITSINNKYLENNALEVELMARGFSWYDAGTHESLLDASVLINSVEKRQGLKIACIEEIALHMGFIDKNYFLNHISNMPSNSYSNYLKNKYVIKK